MITHLIDAGIIIPIAISAKKSIVVKCMCLKCKKEWDFNTNYFEFLQRGEAKIE